MKCQFDKDMLVVQWTDPVDRPIIDPYVSNSSMNM